VNIHGENNGKLRQTTEHKNERKSLNNKGHQARNELAKEGVIRI